MEPKWLQIARQELGVHETPGPRATARIVEYDSVTTYKATSDEVPWCAAFACWCLEKAGVRSPRSAAAADFGDWGKDIGEEPEVGCIVLLSHHVTFYVGPGPGETIACLGGNQSDRVKISNYPVDNVISYRWPKEA